MLGKFCGSKTPHPIIATSNQLLMIFQSDASIQRKGFTATHSTGKKNNEISTICVKFLKYDD